MTTSASAACLPARQGQVLYDGQCPLCLKSVGLLKRLDWFGRLTYVNARDRASTAAQRPRRSTPIVSCRKCTS